VNERIEKFLCFRNLGKLRRRRKTFERGSKDAVDVEEAVAGLVKFRQRQRRTQLEALRLLLLGNGDGGAEGVLGRRCIRRIALQQYLAADAMQECLRVCVLVKEVFEKELPICRDSDDQKFLVATAAAGAEALITKDAALLELARRKPPFRIVKPKDFPFT